MGYLPGARLSFGEHVGLDAVVQALDKLAERVHAGLAEQRRAGRGRYRLRKHAHELFHFFDFFPFFQPVCPCKFYFLHHKSEATAKGQRLLRMEKRPAIRGIATEISYAGVWNAVHESQH